MKTNESNPIGHVTSPYVVGGAIIALKYRDGVVIGTDTLLSYGSLLKYQDVCRYEKVAENILITASGEYSDFQEVTKKLKNMTRQSDIFDDGVKFSAKDYSNYLASICYKKRNEMNPYFNSIVIAGFEQNQSILASVDLYGNYIKKDYVVTGFAKHFGLALIANEWNPKCSLEEARSIIRRAFEVIYMRDCHSIDQIQMATVTRDGARVENPEKIDSKWNLTEFRERKNERLWQ